MGVLFRLERFPTGPISRAPRVLYCRPLRAVHARGTRACRPSERPPLTRHGCRHAASRVSSRRATWRALVRSRGVGHPRRPPVTMRSSSSAATRGSAVSQRFSVALAPDVTRPTA